MALRFCSISVRPSFLLHFSWGPVLGVDEGKEGQLSNLQLLVSCTFYYFGLFPLHFYVLWPAVQLFIFLPFHVVFSFAHHSRFPFDSRLLQLSYFFYYLESESSCFTHSSVTVLLHRDREQCPKEILLLLFISYTTRHGVALVSYHNLSQLMLPAKRSVSSAAE